MRRATAVVAGLCAVVTLAFVITAPWRIGRTTVERLETVMAIWLIPAAMALLHRPTRASVRAAAATSITFRRRTLIVLFVIAFGFFFRATSAKFLAMETSAWDFSISFDRPIERTLHGDVLWSDARGHSMLGVHANWLLFAFVPLYAIHASPWWLIAGQAFAFAAAAAMLFLCVRAAWGDDLLALLVAGAFVMNRYTANAAQTLFTIDVFYPAALFLLFYAFLRERPRLFAIALLLTVAIKEDAFIPLAGFALVAALGYRRWRWATAAMAAGVAVFVVDYFFVLRGFAFWSGPAYANDWESFGPAPLAAAAGMIRHPLKVLWRVATGSADLFATMAFVPLAGWPWIAAALPPLIILGSADSSQVHFFLVHYSMTVLPGLFMAVAAAATQSNSRDARRVIALIVLAVSALVGTTYRFQRARPERRFVMTAVREAGARDVFVQGSLMPHAGYGTNVHPLHHDIVPPRASAFLLCTTCNPYPFSKEQLAARIGGLEARGFELIRHGDIVLLRSP